MLQINNRGMLKVDTIYMLKINKKNTCKGYRGGRRE